MKTSKIPLQSYSSIPNQKVFKPAESCEYDKTSKFSAEATRQRFGRPPERTRQELLF